MTCNKSTMIRLGIGAAILLAAAYVLFPAFQAWIVANGLTLLLISVLLLCPLSMLFMGCMHKDAPPVDDTRKAKPTERNPNDTP